MIEKLKPEVVRILGNNTAICNILTKDQLKINELCELVDMLVDRIKLVESKLLEYDKKIYG